MDFRSTVGPKRGKVCLRYGQHQLFTAPPPHPLPRPERFLDFVSRHRNVRMWFSGHFHLSHNYPDSITTVRTQTLPRYSSTQTPVVNLPKPRS